MAVTLDATARARVIDRVAGILNESYVLPETAKTMSAALRSAGVEPGVKVAAAQALDVTQKIAAQQEIAVEETNVAVGL